MIEINNETICEKCQDNYYLFEAGKVCCPKETYYDQTNGCVNYKEKFENCFLVDVQNKVCADLSSLTLPT